VLKISTSKGEKMKGIPVALLLLALVAASSLHDLAAVAGN